MDARMRDVFSNRTTAILAVLVLIVGLGAATIAVQRSTEFRQRAATPTAPVPGTCFVLEEQYCKTGKPVFVSGEFKGIGFILPAGTPIFAYSKGVVVSTFSDVGTATYRGLSLNPAGQSIMVNTYFKDGMTSGSSAVSKNVQTGDAIGHTNKDPQNQYDLLVNFSKLGNNTITIDQQLTTANFNK